MPLKTNSADFGMDYNLSPPFLSGLISSHPTTPNPTTHPPAKLGGGAHQFQDTLVLSWLRTDGSLCLARPPFTLLLSSRAPTLTLLCFLVNIPHSAHLLLSELIPPSLHYAPIVLGTRPYYEAFPHCTIILVDLCGASFKVSSRGTGWYLVRLCVPRKLIPHRDLNACWMNGWTRGQKSLQRMSIIWKFCVMFRKGMEKTWVCGQ